MRIAFVGELLRFQSRRCGLAMEKNGAAETDGPGVILIDKEETIESMRGAAGFGGPMPAAICRVQECSFAARGPTFGSVHKFDVEQINFDV